MKRIVSILLILALGFSILPVAFSDGEEFPFQPAGDEEILAEVVDDFSDEVFAESVPEEPSSEEIIFEEEHFYGSLPDDYSVLPYITPYKLLLSTSAALPEKYDARELGYVTPVKNQGSYGTCWAFTLMAMAESNILKKYSVATDLAEIQLVWFYYNGARNELGEFNDPLGNFGGDHGYLKPGTTFNSILSLGGNLGTGMTTQASWIGVTPEDELTAYPDSISNIAQNGLPYSYAFENDSFHLKNVRIANIETDIDTVKQMILDYGAVGISYMQSNIYMNGDAYYHPTGTDGSGHAVTIVGWDDNFPVDNFSETYRPQRSGAWLIKNSWGENAGDGGYFWMSYESKHGTNRTNAYAGEYEPSAVYDYCYQYDGGFYTKASASSAKYIYTANVYTARHDELISAVSFWSTRQANVPYTVYLVSEPEEDKPLKGKVLFSKAGMTAQAGYYSEALPEPVYVKEGEKFSVVIGFENTTGGSFSYEYDADYSTDSRYGSESVALKGQSYRFLISTPLTEKTNTKAWTDLSDSGYNNRIKAFTVVSEEKILTESNVTLSYSSVTYDGSEQTPEVQVCYFGKALEENLDYIVTYSDNVEPGLASVTVTGIGGFSGSVTKHFVIKSRQELAVTISRDSLKTNMTAQITVSGAEGVCTFSSTAPAVAKVNSDGVVYALQPGSATITVTAAETEEYGEASCSIPVTVVLPGDVNADKRINTLDFVTLAKWLEDKSVACDDFAADADGNGTVDMDDVSLLMKYLAGVDLLL